ncbi:MAG: cell envelope biogenesis protein TolA [Pseudomonadota bacterium]
MARKLKTFITNIGFFELALAAPSMKAALEAWGMGHNAFQHGFAKQTDDPKIVAATMAKPGVVLRRAVGTKGEFKEQAELPKDLWKLEAPKAEPIQRKTKARAKQPAKAKTAADDKKDRAAILSFEKAKQRRDAAREKEQAEADAKREREQAQIERAVAKANDTLDRARAHHEEIVAAIAAEQDKLDRRAATEKKRWDAERAKLEDARERATHS